MALMTVAGDGGTVHDVAVHDIAVPDMTARRVEVVRRLMALGMPMRALEALLSGWEEAIATVLEADAEHDAAGI